jgi:lysophospholipase L1-like esterase
MSRWLRRGRLAAAALIAIVGAGLMSLDSPRLTVISLVVVGVGAAWMLRTLLPAGGGERLRRNRREIALAVGSTLVSLLVAVALALAVRVGPRLGRHVDSRYDAVLGWTSGDADRVGQRLQPIDPARPHVLLMGDSVIYGHFLKDDQTADHFLNQRYRTHQVLNAAVSGYSIDQYYLSLQTLIPRVRPDVVVVGVTASNDFQFTARDWGWGHSKPMFVVQGGQLTRITGDLAWGNCIDRLAGSLLFGALWRDQDLAQRLLNVLCNTRQAREPDAEEVVRRLLGAIAALAAEHHARLLFVLLPDENDLPNVGDACYLRYKSEYRTLERLLREGGYDHFELYPDLVRAGGDPRSLFIDGTHLVERGQRILADALERELRDRYGVAQ